MGLTVRADLNLSTYSPIHEPQHAHTLPFYFDRSSSGGAGAIGGGQNSLSGLLQQLTGLLQQLTSALGQLQQSVGQNNSDASPASGGSSSGPQGQLQSIIQQLTQLLRQLSQLTSQSGQGDPSNGGSSSGSPAGGPQGQLNSLLQQVDQLLQQLNGGQSDASGQSGQGGYQPTSYGSAPYGGSSSYGGPSNNQGSLTIGPNDTVDTGRFTVNVSGAQGGQLTVTDKNTGKDFTVWGDPHGTTSNGGSFDFQQHPLVYKLPDGTSIEVDPTKNSGVNYIDSVEVKKGGAGVEFDGVHSGNITEKAISGAPSNSNQATIGITVDNNDNQTVNGGPAINGNIGDIDQYAHQQQNGSGSPQIGEKLVHEGRELERYGHDLQRQGKFREGAHLIHEGRHLELQGRRLEHLADRYGAQNNPQVGQQLQQIQNLIGAISSLTQQIGQASNMSFANNFLNNN